MTYFYEYCRTLSNRTGNMITKEDLQGKTGFASIYGFDAQTSAFFREAGSIKGSKHFPVFADTLWMDFDNAEEECERVVNQLVSEGISCVVYTSGGRGQHVGVPHQPIFDRRLPYSQRVWVEGKKFKVDFCLYSHGHIFRLPNTRHAKTGNYKEIIFQYEGQPIELELIERPAKCYSGADSDEFLLTDFVDMLSWFSKNLPTNGNRNHRMFALAAGLLASGISPLATVELVSKFNEALSEPLEEEELTLLLESAVSTIGGSS